MVDIYTIILVGRALRTLFIRMPLLIFPKPHTALIQDQQHMTSTFTPSRHTLTTHTFSLSLTHISDVMRPIGKGALVCGGGGRQDGGGGAPCVMAAAHTR